MYKFLFIFFFFVAAVQKLLIFVPLLFPGIEDPPIHLLFLFFLCPFLLFTSLSSIYSHTVVCLFLNLCSSSTEALQKKRGWWIFGFLTLFFTIFVFSFIFLLVRFVTLFVVTAAVQKLLGQLAVNCVYEGIDSDETGPTTPGDVAGAW